VAVEIFQPSDLNRRGRAVLDAARRSRARIRDKDGLSLLVLPEERVVRLETFARFSQNLFTLERALVSSSSHDPSNLADFDWAWLRAFDAEDVGEFVTEMRQALLVTMHDDGSDLPESVLQRWRITARSLDDPIRRGILLEPVQPNDFVDAHRPEPSARESVP
jgi:hypothetical protein